MLVGTNQTKMYRLIKEDLSDKDYDLGYAAVIKYHREKQEYTLEALSYNICSRSWLSKFENGQCKSKEDILESIFKRLNIREEEVVDLNYIQDLFNRFMRAYLFFEKDQMNSLYEEIIQFHDFFLNSFLIVEYHFVQMIYYVTNDKLDEAMEVSEFIEPLTSRLINLDKKKLFHHIYGLMHLKKGDDNKALENLLIAHHLPGESNHLLLYNIGGAYRRLNNIYLSLQYYEEAYVLFEKENVYFRMLFCQVMIAIMYSKIGWKDRAEDLFLRVIESARHYNMSYPKSIAMLNLSIHYYFTGDYEKSIHILHLVLEEEYFYIPWGYSHAYLALNFIHVNKHSLFEELRYLKRLDDPFFVNLAEIIDFMDQGVKSSNFLEKLEMVQERLERDQFYQLWIEVLKLIIEEYESIRQYKKANEYYKKLYRAHRWEEYDLSS